MGIRVLLIEDESTMMRLITALNEFETKVKEQR
jgi:hypothetical protein